MRDPPLSLVQTQPLPESPHKHDSTAVSPRPEDAARTTAKSEKTSNLDSRTTIAEKLSIPLPSEEKPRRCFIPVFIQKSKDKSTNTDDEEKPEKRP